MGVLDTLAWAFTAQVIASFALGVWIHVSLSFTLQTGHTRSSIIGAILHGVPISVSRKNVAVGHKGADCFWD